MMKIGGNYFSSNDEITSNQLMDAFGSLTLSTGDYTKDPVQVWQVIAHCMIQLLFESVIDIEYFNVSFFNHSLARKCWKNNIRLVQWDSISGSDCW